MKSIIILLVSTLCTAQWDTGDNKPIVHLHEWTWPDIEAHCPYLGEIGFGGIQVSPPGECTKQYSNGNRPWWERYQPVAYTLDSRSGNEEQFVSMVDACKTAGVKIYVDIIMNHMASDDTPSGTPSTGSSWYDAPSQNFSQVPYSYLDFNDNLCQTPYGNISCYNCDPDQVRDCDLGTLSDLMLSNPYVQEKVIGWLNHFLSLGVAGFRVDAAKHMWPGDMETIFNGMGLTVDGDEPVIIQEVIDVADESVSASEYLHLGRITEFLYSAEIGEVFRGNNNQYLSFLSNFGEGWEFMASTSACVFVDNHDNTRGHGAGGPDIINYKLPRIYKMANAFMLAWDYGLVRVFSSYDWPNDDTDIGPPSADDENDSILPPNPTNDLCENGWVCEHLWRQIKNMVGFHNVVDGTAMLNWWDNAPVGGPGGNQIAFSRGDQGFIAFNNEAYDFTHTLQTGLPAGTYCDIISGDLEDGACTGKSVTVDADGNAYIEIKTDDTDGVVAIHVNAVL